jgi:proteasome assembly chaperone (PAC2) family protein
VNHVHLHRELPKGVKTLVAAFGGWSDAGDSATGAIEYLVRSRNAQPLAEFDAEEFFDFTQYRPIVHIDEAGMRSLTWPRNQFFIAEGTDSTSPLLLFMGTEPSLRWKTFANAFLDLAIESGVERMVTCGALLNAVPHTRAPQVNGSGSNAEIQRIMTDLGMQRGGSYTGPTGVASAVVEACQDRNMEYASLWGHVPHYIQTTPNPSVIKAILENLSKAFGIAVDLSDLDGQVVEFRDRCEQAIAQEPSMRAYVQRLEQFFDEIEESPRHASSGTSIGSAEMPNPDDLVEDLEDFLRQRRSDSGDSGT